MYYLNCDLQWIVPCNQFYRIYDRKGLVQDLPICQYKIFHGQVGGCKCIRKTCLVVLKRKIQKWWNLLKIITYNKYQHVSGELVQTLYTFLINFCTSGAISRTNQKWKKNMLNCLAFIYFRCKGFYSSAGAELFFFFFFFFFSGLATSASSVASSLTSSSSLDFLASGSSIQTILNFLKQ